MYLGSILPDEESSSSQMLTHAAKVSYIRMQQNSILYALEHATTLHHLAIIVLLDSKPVVYFVTSSLALSALPGAERSWGARHCSATLPYKCPYQ